MKGCGQTPEPEARPRDSMKVAFVNQPIDTILPPRQNSVGACTYGVAPILAQVV